MSADTSCCCCATLCGFPQSNEIIARYFTKTSYVGLPNSVLLQALKRNAIGRPPQTQGSNRRQPPARFGQILGGLQQRAIRQPPREASQLELALRQYHRPRSSGVSC